MKIDREQLEQKILYEFGCERKHISKKELILAKRIYLLQIDLQKHFYLETGSVLQGARYSFIKEVRDMLNKKYNSQEYYERT